MNLRAEKEAAHPQFPWLDAGEVERVSELFESRGWLETGERVEGCAKAGEGNMNLTLRVRTDRRSMILKQARPWVEKYDHIAAPWDRSLFEQRFYGRVSSIPEVAARMPRILMADERARVLVLEDLGEAADFTDLYRGASITEEEVKSVAQYARALHDATRGEAEAELANREMRALNHAHIFEVPLDAENGVELETHELWLTEAAAELRRDAEYGLAVKAAGAQYLLDGPCLVHGDFFPGSWLRTPDGVKVIDPEFCYFGDAEFDLGVCVAHLRMAGQSLDVARLFLQTYEGLGEVVAEVDGDLVARYASVEVMRRIIGVAQLPIPASEGLRAKLLKNSREGLLNLSLEALWL